MLACHFRDADALGPILGMKADFERSWKEHIVLKFNRLAIFAAIVHWADEENILSIWTLRYQAYVDTGMGGAIPIEKKKDKLGGTSRQSNMTQIVAVPSK